MATNLNGGRFDYADYTPQRTFYRSECTKTKQSVIKSGQVLKARTFLESDANGKLIAHTGLSESAIVKFAALTAGQTLILAGLTWTAGGSGTTVAQLAAAWANIASGTVYTSLSAITAGGTFTAGTLTGWSTSLQVFGANSTAATVVAGANEVVFTSTGGLSNVTDLAATGTGTAPTISKVDGATAFNKIAGVTVYDVDATSADVASAVYVEASFWASALVWAVDPTVDTITKPDGTTVLCTAYNTGTLRESADATRLLQSKFVEGTEFEPLGYTRAGELY